MPIGHVERSSQHESYTSAVDHQEISGEHAPAGDKAEPQGSFPGAEQAHENSTSSKVGFQNLPDRGDSYPPNMVKVPNKEGNGLDQIDLEQYRNPDTSLGNASPMEKIVDHLSPQDALNLSLANKATHAKLGQTGRNFMDAAYKDPKANLPSLLGKSSEPSQKASMAYKMAGLDPQTKLQPHLGQGSLKGKDFRDGEGGFIGKHENPAQTQAEVDAQNKQKMANYETAKTKIEDKRQELKDQGVPEKKWPKLPTPPKPLQPRQAAPSGAQFEYHPGGSTHSNKIPSSNAMGGAYFKVDPAASPSVKGGKKKETGESDSYRVGRYGSFETGQQTGYFYDTIPQKGTEGPLKDLSPKELVEQGSAAEKNGNLELASQYRAEAERRMEQATPGEQSPKT